ncbi:MAG: HAMP domain-containing sensor histidine kinase [Vicinamibacterales bacterium]
MRPGVRGKTVVFIVLGVLGVGGAVALNIGWVIFSWREAGLLVAGLILFPLIITGVVLNTIFLVREIRRNEQHEHFINAVTHELKTPIASVKLHLQTLQQRNVDEAKRQEFYQVMVDDCDRLLSTVEQVLRAGRLRAPQEKGRFHSIDLTKLLDDCLSLAQTRYRLTPGELTYRASIPAGAVPRVMGDEEDLKAVILNLVDNAIKYSGDTVQVAVELAQTGARAATIRVSDRGIGIPVSELGRIFKRFYRIPGAMTSRIKGAGLGLFIVRAVVARHGGTVFAESDGLGHGTTFTVQLPLTTTQP